MRFGGFLLAGLFVLVMGSNAEAQRRTPPDAWCRDMRIGGGPFDTVMVCQAYTREQCLASRTGWNERCYPNPRYQRR